MNIPDILLSIVAAISLLAIYFVIKLSKTASTPTKIYCDPEHVKIIEKICDLIDNDKLIYRHHFMYKNINVNCNTFLQRFEFSNGIVIPIEGEISKMLTYSIDAQKKRAEEKAIKELQ